MNLKQYIEEQDGKFGPSSITLHRIAKASEISSARLYQVALGLKTASPRLACNVEHFSGGAVNRRTTLPSFPWDHPITKQAAA